jgi:3-phenylpropionate/trans-cinnamate dioxygenase ferredoxin subunit
MGEFAPVARVDEIPPGSHRRVTVEGEGVLLANVDGEFHAIADECSHEEARLSQGILLGHHIECPLHGSVFDVKTGAATSLPATTPVAVFETKVEGGQVYVKLPDSG